LLIGGLFSVYAQDMIIMRDGNVIEARVTEISPTEIRYRRFNHLTGPVIVIPRAEVLSIRYENGMVEVITPAQERRGSNNPQSGISSSDSETSAQAITSDVPILGEPNLLQLALNRLPAVRVGSNNLDFTFGGEAWIAKLNGRDFLTGTFTMEETNEGSIILTLKQTHTYPPRDIPRISWVRTPGPEIVLEYKLLPSASLSLVSYSTTTGSRRQRNAEPSVEVTQSEPIQIEPVDDSWRKKWVYLGGGLGGGIQDSFSSINNGYVTDNMFATNLVFELALLPFLSIEFIPTFWTDIGLPIMLKLGYRFPKIEISAEYGFGIGKEGGFGPIFGSTLGYNVGHGIIFVKVMSLFKIGYIDKYYDYNSNNEYVFFDYYLSSKNVFLGFIGYKIGLGKNRKF